MNEVSAIDGRPIIHKQVNRTQRCQSGAWSLCKPDLIWEGPFYNWTNPKFLEWKKTHASRWAQVTCPDCIRLRRFP